MVSYPMHEKARDIPSRMPTIMPGTKLDEAAQSRQVIRQPDDRQSNR